MENPGKIILSACFNDCASFLDTPLFSLIFDRPGFKISPMFRPIYRTPEIQNCVYSPPNEIFGAEIEIIFGVIVPDSLQTMDT
jgi:hypothetical protein